MHSQNNTFFKIFICLFCLCMSLTGCRQLKDRIIAPRDSNSTNGETTNDIDIISFDSHKVHTLNEAISIWDPTPQDPDNTGFECTVTNATLFPTAAESGVSKNDMLDKVGWNYTSSPDTLSVVSADEAYDAPFLLCDIDMKNINFSDEPNITILSLVYVTPDNEVIEIGSPLYFSNAMTHDPLSSKYYHFNLLKGQTASMQIGYYVNLEELDKTRLYLAQLGDRPIYIHLNL